MSYVLDGEIFCEDCAPNNAESIGDWPSESDCPESCCMCLKAVPYTLTSEGVQYVLEAIRESLKAGRKKRNRVLDCYKDTWFEGSRHCEIVREWAEDLKWYGLESKDEKLVEKYLSWTSK